MINSFLVAEVTKYICMVINACRLEYPGVSPELSFLKDTGRAEFYTATDSEALDGMVKEDGYQILFD